MPRMNTITEEGNTYIIGATGTGKSTLILSLAAGAFCLIDKHGTTARELADSMQCIYWRPADLEFPIGLNPLQSVPQDFRWKMTADIVSVFSDIWRLGEATPRLLYYLRAAIRLLLDTSGTTLLQIRHVLSETATAVDFCRNAPTRDQTDMGRIYYQARTSAGRGNLIPAKQGPRLIKSAPEYRRAACHRR